jgi:hypothetical protein
MGAAALLSERYQMTDQELDTAIKVMALMMRRENNPSSRWKIGANYFIRTVTHHLTGKLVDIDDHELWLKDAAWIADDGRFAQAISTCEFKEVEPYPDDVLVAVGRASLIDSVEIKTLPRTQK